MQTVGCSARLARPLGLTSRRIDGLRAGLLLTSVSRCDILRHVDSIPPAIGCRRAGFFCGLGNELDNVAAMNLDTTFRWGRRRGYCPPLLEFVKSISGDDIAGSSSGIGADVDGG